MRGRATLRTAPMPVTAPQPSSAACHSGTLGGIWEVLRCGAATSSVNWTPVTLPHCFNAYDAVDPDREYYEGPGWYRKTVPVQNPYPGGRTLLHFEGAGRQQCGDPARHRNRV